MKHLSRISTHLGNYFSSDAISAFSSVKVNLRLRKPRDILTQKDTKLKLAYRSENHLSQFVATTVIEKILMSQTTPSYFLRDTPLHSRTPMAKLAQQSFARNLTEISGHCLKNFAENIVSIKIKPLFIFNRRSKVRRDENLVSKSSFFDFGDFKCTSQQVNV